MVEVKVGQIFIKEVLIKENMLAINVGSGNVSALATPTLITFMEDASLRCLQEFLPNEMTSVGTEINIKHTNATPRGMMVTVTSTIIAVNGRAITFELSAKDSVGPIGEGTHERFIVNTKTFNEKTATKATR